MPTRTLAAAIFAIFWFAAPARADAIDGDWCAPPGDGGGRIVSIDGSRVITPGGTRMTGNYTRHSFVYTVPEPEPDAGTTVYMSQIDEQTVQVNAGGETNIWNRCRRPTS